MAWHHPDKRRWPEWVIWVGNNLFHRVITICQRMNPTIENVVVIRNFIDALEYVYLEKKMDLDIVQGIGRDSNAVKKALKELRPKLKRRA